MSLFLPIWALPGKSSKLCKQNFHHRDLGRHSWSTLSQVCITHQRVHIPTVLFLDSHVCTLRDNVKWKPVHNYNGMCESSSITGLAKNVHNLREWPRIINLWRCHLYVKRWVRLDKSLVHSRWGPAPFPSPLSRKKYHFYFADSLSVSWSHIRNRIYQCSGNIVWNPPQLTLASFVSNSDSIIKPQLPNS